MTQKVPGTIAPPRRHKGVVYGGTGLGLAWRGSTAHTLLIKYIPRPPWVLADDTKAWPHGSTITLALIHGWGMQKYSYSPGVSNVKDQVSPSLRKPFALRAHTGPVYFAACVRSFGIVAGTALSGHSRGRICIAQLKDACDVGTRTAV